MASSSQQTTVGDNSSAACADREESAAVPCSDRSAGGIAWRECGEGDPVVFLHGLGGTRSSWGSQLRVLGRQFRCIAWDMPGYGSSAPLRPLTFAGIADRLAALLDSLGIERADLVGLSFGGMHALHTALRHPDRVRRMVLADTSPAFGMGGARPADWISDRLAPLEDGSTPDDMADRVIDAITAAPLPAAVRAEIAAAFSEISSGAFRAAVHCLVAHDVRPRLAEISHPTRVIVGELDAETPPSYAQALAAGLADSDLCVLAGVGHLSPAEAPEEFNRLVVEHLSARANGDAGSVRRAPEPAGAGSGSRFTDSALDDSQPARGSAVAVRSGASCDLGDYSEGDRR